MSVRRVFESKLTCIGGRHRRTPSCPLMAQSGHNLVHLIDVRFAPESGFRL